MPSVTAYGTATWRALGSYVQLIVADEQNLPAARARTVELLDAVDLAASRFRPDSDLVRANAGAGDWVTVSPLLVQALQAAVAAAGETDGLVDPTLGLSLVAAGYDRDLAAVQARDHGPAAVPVPAVPQAWRALRLDPDGAVLVPFGVALDLGSTGKAFAADLVAQALAGELGIDCIISLGGDVAIGDADEGDPPVPWRVAVGEAPDAEPDETVVLDRGGVATSSTVHRRWTRGGRELHHLLDPRTGAMVDPVWRTVSVTGASCVAANTASTAAMVLGALATTWLQDRDIPGRLVDVHGTVTRICGWPEEDG